MKQFFLFATVCALLFTLVGCYETTDEGTMPVIPAVTSVPTSPTQAIREPTVSSKYPIVAISVPAVTESYAGSDGTLLFTHTYQTMHLTMPDPEVADSIILHYLTFLDDIHAETESIFENIDSKGGGFSQILLSPQRVDLGVLSLFGNYVTSSAGGHPSRTALSLNYDMLGGYPLTLASIMDPNTTATQFSDLVIDVLEKEASSLNLYEDYADIVRLKLSGDVSQFESFYFTSTGLCFYFDHYEIAPYASGIISVEIPFSKLTGVLHDAYFPPESETADGNIFQENFDIEKHSQYSLTTEAIITPDADMVLFSTDSLICNLKISATAPDTSQARYTVYAANRLQQDEAVVITATANEIENLQVIYGADG